MKNNMIRKLNNVCEVGDITVDHSESCARGDNPFLFLNQYEDTIQIRKDQWPAIRDYLEEYFK